MAVTPLALQPAALDVAPRPIPVAVGLATALIAGTLLDLRYRRLPDGVTVPLAAAGLALAPLTGGIGLAAAVAGLVGAGGAVWLVAVAFRRLRGVDGLGDGDVRLVAAIGAWLGPYGCAVTVAVAAGAALASTVVGQMWRYGRIDRMHRVPFGTFLSGAFWLVWWSALDV
jgi:leader peptidase (prepilin peptidase)/N-methyltransferase